MQTQTSTFAPSKPLTAWGNSTVKGFASSGWCWQSIKLVSVDVLFTWTTKGVIKREPIHGPLGQCFVVPWTEPVVLSVEIEVPPLIVMMDPRFRFRLKLSVIITPMLYEVESLRSLSIFWIARIPLQWQTCSKVRKTSTYLLEMTMRLWRGRLALTPNHRLSILGLEAQVSQAYCLEYSRVQWALGWREQ